MESERFDALTRHVGAAAGTRRLALRTLLGAAAALVGGALGADVVAAGCRTNRACGPCGRCKKRSGERTGRCVAANNGRACNGECGVCRSGRCRPANEGEACRQCGTCRDGRCRPVGSKCGGTNERCSTCRQDGFCTPEMPCPPCFVCDQNEGCVEDHVLICGENRECCFGDCCEEGESCKRGICCTPDRECGEACCLFGMYCANATRSLCCVDGHSRCGTGCCNTAGGCYECVNGQCRYKCEGFDFCVNGVCENCPEDTGCGG